MAMTSHRTDRRRLGCRWAALWAAGIVLSLGLFLPAEEPAATPTPSPTASPTPTAAPPPPATPSPAAGTPVVPMPPLQFIPPLSLAECQDLMSRAETLVPSNPQANPDAAWVASLQSMVETSANYLRFRSDLHTSLSQYRWVELGGGRVENNPGGVDRDEKIFDPPVEGISALSLEARNGDVYLHRLVVYDEKQEKRQEFDFSKEPDLLRHAIPRRDVYHLYRRSTISRIEMEYSTVKPWIQGEPRVRVAVFAGMTNRSRPEFVKTSIWHLQEARKAIGERNWPRAKTELSTANSRLSEYIRRNNPK